MFRVKNEHIKRNSNKNLFIAIAGNVGTGKSTFTKLIGEELSLDTHYEMVDGNPYLEDFYSEKESWGFHLQLYFLAQRFKQQEEIDSSNTDNIQDRSIYEDVEIFAKNLHDNKIMSDRDYETYRSIYEDMLPRVRKPDLMIYLDGSLDTILKRIDLRGRGMEQKTDIEYWRSLHQKYENWIESCDSSPVLYINIDKVDLIEKPEQIKLLCKEIKKVVGL